MLVFAFILKCCMTIRHAYIIKGYLHFSNIFLNSFAAVPSRKQASCNVCALWGKSTLKLLTRALHLLAMQNFDTVICEFCLFVSI